MINSSMILSAVKTALPPDSLNTRIPLRFIPNDMQLDDLVYMYNISDAAGLFFCGATTLLVFFISLLYVKNREKIYLHYTFFLFFSLMYGFTHVDSMAWLQDSVFSRYFDKRLGEPVTILAFSFYIFFTIELIDIRRQSRSLYSLLKVFGYATVVYSLSYYILFPFISSFEHVVFLTARAIIFPLSFICMIWVLVKIKSPVRGYFIVGSLAYYLGAIVATIRYTLPGIPFAGFYSVNSFVYFEAGIMVEILCFALALGQRIYYLHQEKQSTNEKLIDQLSINEQLAKNVNERLESEVRSRTAEILETHAKLQEQEKKRLQIEYERDIMQAEMLAHRLQVNSHFLFNCLTAIKYLIQSGQNEKASQHLVAFSRFIRMVQDTAERKMIPLIDELEIVESFLKLEKNRFDNNFSYLITGKDRDKLKNMQIPPLLLQPFVDNAIWHGLLTSAKKDKLVEVSVCPHETSVDIIIDDNGVGRLKAEESAKGKLYKSMGIYLTEERIRLYNYFYNNILDFKIVDKVDEHGASLGTRIVVNLKYHHVAEQEGGIGFD